jgi:hypothetical protein
MGRNGHGLLQLAAVIAIVAGTIWLLYVVYRSPHRQDLEAYVAFVISVGTITVGWIVRAWHARIRQGSETIGAAELDHVTDLLAGAVKNQWTHVAADRGLLQPEPIPVRWQRPSLPVAGPVSAAVGSERFPPLPLLPAIGRQRLRAGRVSDLHAVYGGLGSGRLVIVGAPGSGKSGAAVLLLLAALKHREKVPEDDRRRVPVPVMFTLHDWDPNRQRVREWITNQLQQTYPLLAGKGGAEEAAALLTEDKVAVMLDGLDEVPLELRPYSLRALSQQATFRVILLTRRDEMAEAASQGLLEGAAALELQSIDAMTAAEYLKRVQLDPAPRGWRELTDRLQHAPDSAIARALSSPLTLTLVRDTYRTGDDVRELLDFCDDARGHVSRDDIVGHLLDRILPAAYAQRPGRPAPRYDLQTAQHALCCLAAWMNQDGTRDLQWWRIREWAPATPRIVASGLAFGLLAGLLAGFSGGPAFGLLVWLAAGLMFGLPLRLRGEPQLTATIKWRQVFRLPSLAFGLTVGLAAGLAVGLAVGLTAGLAVGLTAGLTAGLAVAFTAGLAATLTGGPTGTFSQSSADNASPLSPRTSWRTNRTYGIGIGLSAGLAFGLAVGLAVGLTAGLAAGLGSGLAAGLAAGLAFRLVAGPAYGLAAGLITGLGAGLATGFATGLPIGLAAGLAAGLSFGLALGAVGGFMYSSTWSASLAFAQLAARWHTPIRLMRFLADARDRNVLRTVGPVYQFRHALLQDRLADQAFSGPGMESPRPSSWGRMFPRRTT